ncbi:pyridoxamine 5'-phosphate oxidase family protein [Flavobacteriaceae bacterium 3-367]
MIKEYFDEVREELEHGATKKGHPFRYFTLGTVGLDRLARLRTVVLRKITEDLVLTFYTDKRSKKVTHIKENNKVSLLFYHPEKLLQLKIEGIASLNLDDASKKRIWDRMEASSKKGYTTVAAPGSEIEGPEAIEYLEDRDYFGMITVHPFKIEYLKLEHPSHLRVRFSKQHDLWVGEFLVP